MNLPALITDVYARAGEATNSLAPAVMAGTGTGNVTNTSTVQITFWINEAYDDLARSCAQLETTGTYSVPASTLQIPFTALTYADSIAREIWAPRVVVYNGVRLKMMNESRLDLELPAYQSTAADPPLYWYPITPGGIGITPQPVTGSLTLSVSGLGLPVALSGSASPGSWLPDDQHFLLSLYAAYQVAFKNLEDPSLEARIQPLMQEYTMRKGLLATRMGANDPGLFDAHYAQPQAAS